MAPGIMVDRANTDDAAISIQSAIAMTGRSQRTWWRRIEEGVVRKSDPDARGRARVSLEDVVGLLGISLSAEDRSLLVLADAGDADAQDDVGQMFLAIGKHEIGRYWLELAAEQNHPNAMQRLACCHLSGEGVAKDENMAIRWLAEAAAHGHVIAQEQMRALRTGLLARRMA
ncbi:sel1 repeat family protein [Variovorax sp. J2P1-59]|uniref:tetratricopeptide repeat protein n=1 Tax=Variovorax flavidus TaxID=3053501 RepID=UPI002576E90F|nr:sel1 repeat family protein [Variovorax sp. J2P1-59]MDM0074486.1 sel1 repeat family protein [Variovorax sp. J2P1-59]